MPKGGDLHSHVSGAIYAESFLRAAAEDGNCINPQTSAIVGPDASGSCGTNIPAARLETDNTLRSQMIESLSMRDFVAGQESGHDHFFAAFSKVGPWKEEHRGEFLAEVTRRAADQNESYLELMGANLAAGASAGRSRRLG